MTHYNKKNDLTKSVDNSLWMELFFLLQQELIPKTKKNATNKKEH
jgi:hypothetical protein